MTNREIQIEDVLDWARNIRRDPGERLDIENEVAQAIFRAVNKKSCSDTAKVAELNMRRENVGKL